MYGHGGGLFSGGMYFGGGLMWVFWIIVLVVLVYVLKLIFGSVRRDSSSSTKDPMEILKERFAKGEIDEAEFERRKKLLESPHE